MAFHHQPTCSNSCLSSVMPIIIIIIMMIMMMMMVVIVIVMVMVMVMVIVVMMMMMMMMMMINLLLLSATSDPRQINGNMSIAEMPLALYNNLLKNT